MKPSAEDILITLELLEEGPLRIENSVRGVLLDKLHLRTAEEPWSVSDILAHLRTCSDVWGSRVIRMIAEDNPTMRYVSPRSWMKKPQYQDQEFNAALENFTLERKKLVEVLSGLNEDGWAPRGTFTGASLRQRDQTVWS